MPGEETNPEQPVALKPAPFSRQLLTADLLTTRTPEVRQWALEQFKSFQSKGQFVPFAVDKDTVVFPGYDGGAEWGGQAFDPETGLYYVNANDLAWTGGLAVKHRRPERQDPVSAALRVLPPRRSRSARRRRFRR